MKDDPASKIFHFLDAVQAEWAFEFPVSSAIMMGIYRVIWNMQYPKDKVSFGCRMVGYEENKRTPEIRLFPGLLEEHKFSPSCLRAGEKP
jgi:hypothetical protein